jgi:hypothetical protein
MGVDLRVDGAVPELKAAIEAGMARYPSHLGVGGRLEVQVIVVAVLSARSSTAPAK